MKIFGFVFGFLVISPIVSYKPRETIESQFDSLSNLQIYLDPSGHSVTCIPPVSIENVNDKRRDVLPSYIRYKKDCAKCCRNPLFSCTKTAVTMVPVKYHEISSSYVYLGEKTKHVIETVACHCFCKISQSDCPTGTKFNGKMCLCLPPNKPFTYDSGTC